MARSRQGHLAVYPVTQTVHRDSICAVTETPADVAPAVAAEAADVARAAIACLPGAGVFGCATLGPCKPFVSIRPVLNQAKYV